MSRRNKGPIEPGRVRRTSPNTCSVMPFPGSTVDELEQLRWLAQHYAKHVPTDPAVAAGNETRH